MAQHLRAGRERAREGHPQRADLSVLARRLPLVREAEIGHAGTLDLAVLVLVANTVQNGIIGDDVSVTGAVVLFGMNAAFARAAFPVSWMSWLLEGNPTTLISDAKINVHSMLEELFASLDARAVHVGPFAAQAARQRPSGIAGRSALRR